MRPAALGAPSFSVPTAFLWGLVRQGCGLGLTRSSLRLLASLVAALCLSPALCGRAAPRWAGPSESGWCSLACPPPTPNRCAKYGRSRPRTCCGGASCHPAFSSSTRHCGCWLFHGWRSGLLCRARAPFSRTCSNLCFCLKSGASWSGLGLSRAALSAFLFMSVTCADTASGGKVVGSKSGSQGARGRGATVATAVPRQAHEDRTHAAAWSVLRRARPWRQGTRCCECRTSSRTCPSRSLWPRPALEGPGSVPRLSCTLLMSPCRAAVFNGVWFCSLGRMWQHLGTFFVVTTGAGGRGCATGTQGMLNILRYPGRSPQ